LVAAVSAAGTAAELHGAWAAPPPPLSGSCVTTRRWGRLWIVRRTVSLCRATLPAWKGARRAASSGMLRP